jgi:hypothetical protein
MTEEPIKEDPVEKFRKLIASFMPFSRLPKKEVKMDDEKTPLSSLPRRNAEKDGKLSSLPKKKDAAAKPESASQAGSTGGISRPGIPASGPSPKFDAAPQAGFSAWAPRFWTTASAISLAINVIMTIILIILVISVYRLKLDMAKVMNAGTALMALPGGLYSNFELMERASIETNIPVQADIPVKFDLLLNQATNVTLSQSVTINNALVTVNTGGLNITQANTTIVLPAGTVLPITLNLTVPVDKQIPVTLNVPVNIPLSATKLNEPFIGLQNVIQPIYCITNPEAVDMDGQPICP